MSPKRLNVEKIRSFFRNPPLPQIRLSTFSVVQKGCAYYEKSANNECAYNEWAQ